MTRASALATLRTLAIGLPADVEGVRRFLERISARDDAELLRDLLVEEGARALLDGATGQMGGYTPPKAPHLVQGRSKPRARDPQNVHLEGPPRASGPAFGPLLERSGGV
jgi:hypothetical protein